MDDLRQILAELQQLERELVEQRYLRRSDGIEQVREGLRRLGEIGSPAGIISRSAAELATSGNFALVLVSRIAHGRIYPQALWSPDDDVRREELLAMLAARTIRLSYPLIEAEVAEHHRPAVVSVTESGPRACRELVEAFAWRTYAVGHLMLEGRTIGLIHASCPQHGEDVDELDLELVTLYADGLGHVFERAVLREYLRHQRRVLESAGHWISANMTELSALMAPAKIGTASDGDRERDVLTPRELQVMRLIAQGRSNRDIAGLLVVAEGTVKYHVKNILRKLDARSRTEAISRYVHLYGAPGRP